MYRAAHASCHDGDRVIAKLMPVAHIEALGKQKTLRHTGSSVIVGNAMQTKIFGALMALCALSSPAYSAAGLYGAVNFHATAVLTSPGPPGTLPVVQDRGTAPLIFKGVAGGLLDSTNSFGAALDCVACMSYLVSGSSVTFTRLPAFAPAYGYYSFSLNFDRDLGNDLNNIVGAGLLGGSMQIYSGHVYTLSITGPAILEGSAIYALPEPSNWILMIAGLGLAGGVLRKQKLDAARINYA